MSSRLRLQWTTPPAAGDFRTGVSLHSHTLHSRESLDCIDAAASKSRMIAAAVSASEQRYYKLNNKRLDLRRGWWTPPLGPLDAWKVEFNQIDNLDLRPLVSLTDHDDIEAPTSLQVIEQCRDVPISVEWTVPYGPTFFHLGVHNLPPAEARALYAEMEAFRISHEIEKLPALLETLTANRETLLILNHPFWDEKGIGAAKHEAVCREFIGKYGTWLHALEINGLRPWKENQRILKLSEGFAKPVISGGDRHAIEPNAVLNLTNAGTFAEFVEEVRAGWSDVYVLNQYREAYLSRVIWNIVDVLSEIEDHPHGWRLWSDRIFYQCDDGQVRSLGQLFTRGTPAPLAIFVGAIQLTKLPQVRWLMSEAFLGGERVVL
jgi:hypothetical protein